MVLILLIGKTDEFHEMIVMKFKRCLQTENLERKRCKLYANFNNDPDDFDWNVLSMEKTIPNFISYLIHLQNFII